MRRARVKTYSVLGTLFVLAVAVTVLATADLGVLASPVERYVAHRLGRDVAIDGNFSLFLGNTISVTARDVRIAAPAWARESDLASAALLEFDLVATSLWSETIDIQRLRIEGLKVNLERSESGADNWTFTELDDDLSEALPAIVRSLVMQNAQLTYAAASDLSTLEFALTEIRGTERDDGNIEYRASGQLNETALELQGSIGPTEQLIKLKNTGFSLDGSLGDIKVSGEGQIDNLLRPRRPRGTLKVRGPNAEYLTDILGLRDVSTGPLHLDASIKLSGDQLDASVRGTFGEFDIDLTGSFVELGELDEINLRLHTAGPDAGAVARLAGLRNMPGQSFTLDAMIGSDNGDLVIERIDADIGETSLDFTGRFPDFPSPNGGVGQLTLAGPELGEYSHLLGLPGTLTGPFEVAADLEELSGGDTSLTAFAESPDIRLSVEGTIASAASHVGSSFAVIANGQHFKPVGLAIGLADVPDGRFDFRSAFTLAENGIALDEGVASLGRDRLMISGLIGYQPLEKDTDLKIAITGPDITSTLRAWGYETGRLPSEKFSVTGELRRARKYFELGDVQTLIGDADDFNISLDGRLAPEANLVGSVLHIETTGPSLAALTDILDLPYIPDAEFDIRARLERVDKGWEFDDGIADIGNASLEGQGLIGNDPLERDTELELSGHSDNLKVTLSTMGIEPGIAPAAAADAVLSIRPKRDDFELHKLTLTLPKGTLEANGSLGDSLDLEGSSLQVGVTGDDFSYLLPDSNAYSGLAKPFNLSGGVRKNGETLTVDKLKLSIEKARITGGLSLGLAPLAARGSFSVNASAPNLEKLTPRFDEVRQGRSVPMELKARGNWAGSAWVFDEFSLQLSNDLLSATGSVAGPPDFGEADLEVDWQIADLSNFNPLTGYDWPQEEAKLNFRLSGAPGRLNLDHLRATVGRSDIAGTFTLLSGQPMSLDASFRSQRLDIRRYLPAPPPAPPTPPSDQSSRPESVSSDQRVIPDTVVDLQPLNQLNAKVDLKVDRLKLTSGVLRDLELSGTLDTGALRVDRFSLRGFDKGSLAGSMQLGPSGDGSALSLELGGKNISLGFIVEGFKDMQFLPRYDVDASISMSGATLREMAASLDGEMRLVAGEGRIKATALRYVTSDIFMSLVNVVNPFAKSDEYADITCAVILLDAANGLVSGKPAYVMQSEKVDVFSDLELDLKTEEIKLQVKTVAQKGLGLSVSDLVNPYTQITGTLANPRMGLDPKGTIIEGGVAVITAGLSIAVTQVSDRFFSAKDQCGKALREAD